MSIAPSPRALVADRLLRRTDAVVDALVRRLRAEIPAYADLSGAQDAEVRAIAAWAVRRVLEAWVAGTELGPADLQRFRGIGAARALDGRPLPGVLRAYRLGGTAVTDLVASEGADLLDVGDALALARLWMASIDALSEALYDGYAAASSRASHDPAGALADLLDDLLAGRQATRTALGERTRALGVSLPARPVLVLAPRALPGALLARTESDIALSLVAEPPTTEAPGAAQGLLWWVAARGVTDLPRAHRLVGLGHRHAPAAARDAGRPLGEADALTVAALRAHRDADPARLAEVTLGSAPDHLLAGLDAVLRHGSETAAADHLGLHVQSLRHRQRRLRALTGLDDRRPWDRLVLTCARWAPAAEGTAPSER